MLACLDPLDHLRISVVLAPISHENSFLKTLTVTVHLSDYYIFSTHS